MSARDVILEASETGVRLFLKEGRLAIRAREGRITDDLRTRIRKYKAEIIEELLAGEIDRATQAGAFELLERPEGGIPLSYGQERLWLIDRINGGSPEYNSSLGLMVDGEPNVDALNSALQQIIERHEILRTVYETDEAGRPVQVVRPAPAIKMTLHDLSGLPPEGREAKAIELARDEATRPFDLSSDLMIRACLVKFESHRFEMLVTIHHIASDGWSVGVLTRELCALYAAHVNQTDAGLQPLPIHYTDYAVWQRRRLVGEALEKSLVFWTWKLQGIPETHRLPLDRARPEEPSRKGGSVPRTIRGPLLQSLSRFAGDQGVTLFVVLHAAFASLLRRMSGETDVVIGIPVANRKAPEFERLVGFFANTLALRSDFSSDPTFQEVVAQSKAWLLDAQQHQDLPFEKLVDALRPGRSLGHSPLFQVALSLQEDESQLDLPGIRLQVKHQPSFTAKFDLHLDVTRGAQELLLNWDYATDLFDERSVERMAAYFRNLLQAAIEAPQAKVSQLPLLDRAEEQRLLEAWRERERFEPRECVHQWFEAQVERDESAPAVTFDGKTLSYGELNARANRLAHRLIERGAGPDTLVGLSVERSLDLVVGVLGILKAGGAYVPLDPDYPEARLRGMIEDSGVGLVVTQRAVADRLPLGGTLALELDGDPAENRSDNPRVSGLDPSHLAYVMYTSGSTGEPKGVMVEHRQVARLFMASERLFGFGRKDVWTLFHSYAFDFSVWEIWGALAYGGRLVVVPREVARTPEAFHRLLREEAVTVLNQTPTAFAQLSAADGRLGGSMALRVVVFGGEALKLGELAEWVERRGDETPRLVNMYGITETTVHVTHRRIRREDVEAGRGSVIGRALDDLRLYALDERLAVAPTGVAGELYVGGAGVARGYWRRDELTARRFLDDPHMAGGRLYRTGDVARYLPSGEFEYLGRADGQVKIRGFRIELGEIEHRLSKLEGVLASTVAVRENEPGDKRLVAYVALGAALGEMSPEARREFVGTCRESLAGQLPAYMVPSAYVLLESLPLTVNGKVDRTALPAPDEEAVPRMAHEEPRDELEERICAVWAEVLGLERVGVLDNFFNVGGDSILSIQIVSLLESRGVSVSVKDLFQHQTVAALAEQVRSREAHRAATVEVEPFALLSPEERERVGGEHEDVYPLSALQAGMVFHTQLEGFSGVYHDVMSDHVKCPWDRQCFEAALERCMRRHPILRTGFDLSGGRPLQHVHRFIEPPLEVEDLRGMSREAQERRIGEWTEARKRHEFDWSSGPLFQMNIFRRTDDSFEFGLSFHHAILDGWSRAALSTQLFRDYERLLAGESLGEVEPDWTYRNFIALEREALADPQAASYFAGMLAEAPERQLPRRAPGAGGARRQGRHSVAGLGQRSEELFGLARELGAPVQTLLLAAHFKVLASLSGEAVALSAVTHNGRPERAGAEWSLGLYLNSAPLAIQLGGGSWADLVERVAEANTRTMAHRLYPLSAIQKDSGREFSEVTFNYTHFHVVQEILGREGSQIELLQSHGFEQTNFDFHVEVSRELGAERLDLTINYDADLYEREWIERVGGYYLEAVRRMLADPRSDHAECELLSEAERGRLLRWGAGAEVEPVEDNATDLLARGLAIDPKAVAARCGERELSYGQLETRANRLANYLQEAGLGAGSRVGIYLDRSLEQLVAVLGTLKSGASYVPLDVESPPSRLRAMLADSEVELALLRSADLERLPLGGVDVLLMDEAGGEDWLDEFDDTAPEHGLGPESEAYVLYTSGSTGEPKGVRVNHGGLANYLAHAARQYIDGEIKGAVVCTPLCFDATLTTLLAPLCAGLPVELIEPGEGWLDRLAGRLFESEEGLLFKLTPAHLDALSVHAPDEPRPARHRLVVGGEQFAMERLLACKRGALPAARFVNEYGPTETVVGCSVYEVDELDDDLASRAAVPIGSPIANTRLYVVGADGGLSPAGSVGELCIGGAGVAPGYVNGGGANDSRFVADPFHEGGRMYRSGDRARWLDDGTLEYVGRRDDQVKIRGHRVELGEVESALRACAGVREAAVVEREGRLAAYVVAGDGPESASSRVEGYRRELGERLPEYMTPAFFVAMDSLPLTPNGKVDRAALPAPDGGSVAAAEYEAPRDELESTLCRVWAEVLGLERVGVRDNFFSLGGDSILSIRVVALLKAEGISLGVQDLFRHQNIAKLAAHVATGAATGATELEVTPFSLLTDEERARSGGYEDAYPLSALQAGMVFHTQLEQFDGIYHDINSEHVKCPWERECFERALAACIERHPILRTGFDLSGDRPLQHVWAKIEPPLAVEDWRGLAKAEQEDRLAKWLEERKRHVFDWSRGPLFQVNIFLRTDESFQFAISFHHSILDGWSRAALTTELYNRYERLLAGETPEPVEPDWTYRHFVALEQAAIAEPAAGEYFAEMLAEAPERQLPRYGHSGGETGVRREVYEVEGFAGLSKAVLNLSKRLGVPVQAALLAAHFKVLSALSGQRRVMSCVSNNGRPERADSDRGLGLFLNSVPMALELEPGSWQTLIERVAGLHAGSLAHRRYPLSRIQQDLGRTYSEVLFNYMHFHVYDSLLDSELDLELLDSSVFEHTNFDLTVDVARELGAEEMRLSLNYDADVFPAELVERIGAYYRQTFESMLADPLAPHRSCTLATAEERRRLSEWNDTAAEFPQVSVHELFEARVARDASAPALRFEDRTLSYGELNARANQVAHFLIERGVGPDTLVGLCAARSLETAIGVLGILKAGGAYVPLDPDYPERRLRHMLEDSAVELVLTQRGLLERLPLSQAQAVPLDEPESFSGLNADNPRVEGLSPSHLAYVIYTSGSTGRPKGVMVEHRGVVNYLWHAAQNYLGAGHAGAVMGSPLSFDATVTTLLTPWVCGKCLVVLGEGDETLFEGLTQYLFEDGRNWLFKLTPSHLEWLSNRESGTDRGSAAEHTLVLGGEQLRLEAIRDWKARRLPASTFINEYGPTETVVGCSTYWVRSLPDLEVLPSVVPIGRGIANTRLRVMTAAREEAPLGVTGELHIGGAGVARGYLNRADLTQAGFLTDDAGRWYRTGDLARWLPNGCLEFIGRTDDQVKIRGFRIEPGEIEAWMTRSELVRSAAVVAREDTPGEKRLVGYVTLRVAGNDSEQASQIRAELRKALPEHMVPGAIVVLDELPLTANGKIDRTALPAPDRQTLAMPDYLAPRNETERTLCEIWQAVLKVERVGVEDNFFALGGDSILSMLVVSRANQAGIGVTTRQVFSHQSVAELAAQADLGSQAERPLAKSESSVSPPGGFPNASVDDSQLELWRREYAIERLYRATPMQQGMFFHTLLDRSAYLVQVFPTLEGDLDAKLLRRAWELTVKRYDIFRTAFVGEGGWLHQLVVEEAQLPWHEEDWRGLGEAEQESRFEAYRARDRSRGFELSRPPLQRIALFRLGETRYRLLWSHHHIVLDGWCTPLVYRDVMRDYYRLAAGGRPERETATPFEPYVEWLLGQDEAAAKAYWSEYLSSVETPSLLSRAQGAVAGAKRSRELSLSREETARLQAFAKSQKTTVNALLQLAWGLVLRHYCDTDEVLFGTVVSGRPAELPGMESMVGLFINTLPVKVSFGQATEIGSLSRDLGLALQESVSYGHLPLAEIQKQSRIEGGVPLLDTLLVLENVDTWTRIAFGRDAADFQLDSAFEAEAGPNKVRIDHIGADTRDTYDLTLSVLEQERLTFVCDYADEVFTEAFVAQMLRRFSAALKQLPTAGSVDEVQLIASAERDQLLQWGGGAEVALSEDNALDLLARGFAIDPQKPAARSGGQTLSFGELETRANRLANYLLEAGLGRGSRVGIYLERSLEQLVAVLGTLKSGASYVPLDVESPPSRLRAMLADSEVELALLRSADLERLPLGGVDVLLMDEAGDDDWLGEFDDDPPEHGLGPGDEAYVLYTSGSTGEPKGVRVNHGGLVNYLAHAARQYIDGEIKGAVVCTPLCFDATLTTLLAPLCAGLPVELIEPGEGWLDRLAGRLFKSEEGLLFKLTPAHLDALATYAPAQPNRARHRLVVGGEQFGMDRLLTYKRGALPAARFVNEYGPTETVVGCSAYEVDELDADLASRAAVPIGSPIANTRLYVVGADGRLAPTGGVGELHIGGAGVSLGYVNGDVNGARFLEDRFAGTGRMYRSGDRARWLDDGTLEYVGRRDDQVKIRGHRVELGEVESALRACAGVRAAAVVQRDSRLVAYVVGRDGADASPSNLEGYRSALGKLLPGYMVPAFFVPLDSLPLTPNGKVDRAALPAPDGGAAAAAEYEAPRSELESRLCQLWAEILGLERVGVRDNFFSIGGDSILSIRVVASLKAQGISLGVQDLFRHQTIAELAAHVESGAATGDWEPEVSPFSLLSERERLELTELQKNTLDFDDELIEAEL